ncbi:MAG: type II toxin-antitoxin system RelE/ParE family toxin [Gammaproteobacteria bacterium]|nr:type II toxin-antitoxin system RelE/ParE family toxin [Gammaproteobacteria bacterium]MDE0257235.1 type II toxin-antitoxin system RelE/ParE family toxin [Gammaproteobacteria bacterium]
MIRTFRHRGLKRLFGRADASRVPADQRERIGIALAALDAAKVPSDVSRPGYRLHPLKGSRAGYWSISLTRTWRIVFRMHEGNAYDVDLVDYH